MRIYKISVKNPELKELLPAMYFQEQKSAEITTEFFNMAMKEEHKIEWLCEIIEPLSHEETFLNLQEIVKKLGE